MPKRRHSTLEEQLCRAVTGCGLSLNELERRSGVSHAVLSRFLRGDRTITLPLASRLCDALGLRLAAANNDILEAPPAQAPDGAAPPDTSGRRGSRKGRRAKGG